MLAVVLEALIKVSKRALKGLAMVALAIAAFIAIAFLKMPFPVIISRCGACGVVMHLAKGWDANEIEAGDACARCPNGRGRTRAVLSHRRSGRRSGCCRSPRCFCMLGGEHVFAAEALFFSKMAAVTFGGAYAVLAYVAQQAVEIITGCSRTRCWPGSALPKRRPVR